MKKWTWLPLVVVLLSRTAVAEDARQQKFQYEAEGIQVVEARADEPLRAEVSLDLAAASLENGALAWSKTRKCVTCHTNGSYMVTRPALTSVLQAPSNEIRTFFVDQLKALKALDREEVLSGIRPAQVAYIAAGLAEWDAHVSKALSPETDESLRFLFDLQLENGAWGSLDCWPPFESDMYHVATVAAMAAATAPGWLAGVTDEEVTARIEKMKTYLRTTEPPHDYGRVLLLWISTRLPDLIPEARKTDLAEMVWRHQQEDGGWSIRSFAAPEQWGSGNRSEKLRGEPDFASPPSDGHQTGLAVIVLRDTGVPADDPRLQAAVRWLKSNQRESGRWWTRSLNTDTHHFITYSGTCYALLALEKCGALPQ
jgi:squalene-hopene/tetraprenyl-beta-curcumene cyclase